METLEEIRAEVVRIYGDHLPDRLILTSGLSQSTSQRLMTPRHASWNEHHPAQRRWDKIEGRRGSGRDL
jgi:hypothetical protein